MLILSVITITINISITFNINIGIVILMVGVSHQLVMVECVIEMEQALGCILIGLY